MSDRKKKYLGASSFLFVSPFNLSAVSSISVLISILLQTATKRPSLALFALPQHSQLDSLLDGSVENVWQFHHLSLLHSNAGGYIWKLWMAFLSVDFALNRLREKAAHTVQIHQLLGLVYIETVPSGSKEQFDRTRGRHIAGLLQNSACTFLDCLKSHSASPVLLYMWMSSFH